MPKATVNEDGNPMFCEHKIGGTFQIAPMQTETEPHCMGHFPNSHFRLSILTSNLSHYLAALGRTQPIHFSPSAC